MILFKIKGVEMTEKVDKLRKALELSDLLFLREKEKLISKLEESLRKISNEFERRGLTNSELPVVARDKKREEIIKKLVNFRVNSDLNEVSKVTNILNEDISNKIYKRAQEIVTGPLKKFRFEKVNNEEELKNRLLSDVKREIKIYKMKIESQPIEEKEFLLGYIKKKIKSINKLMIENHKIELFKIQDKKVWSYLYETCLDEKSFDSQINALKNIIDWINSDELKKLLKNKVKNGSVNILELFLKENHLKYNSQIIKRFRRIITIRKKFPIHKDTTEVKNSLAELGLPFPINNFQETWTIILLEFIVSLRELEEILLSNIN